MNLINCMCAFVWLCRVFFFISVVCHLPARFYTFVSAHTRIECSVYAPVFGRPQRWAVEATAAVRQTVEVDAKATIDLYSLNVGLLASCFTYSHSLTLTHSRAINSHCCGRLSLFFASVRGSSLLGTSSFRTHSLHLCISVAHSNSYAR